MSLLGNQDIEGGGDPLEDSSRDVLCKEVSGHRAGLWASGALLGPAGGAATPHLGSEDGVGLVWGWHGAGLGLAQGCFGVGPGLVWEWLRADLGMVTSFWACKAGFSESAFSSEALGSIALGVWLQLREGCTGLLCTLRPSSAEPGWGWTGRNHPRSPDCC